MLTMLFRLIRMRAWSFTHHMANLTPGSRQAFSGYSMNWEFHTKRKKQEFGQSLTIIGLKVSLDSMLITMLDDKCTKLIEDILDFIGTKTHQHPLRDWQRLLGHCNWALNTYPLLQPALQSSYLKIRGKTLAFVGV